MLSAVNTVKIMEMKTVERIQTVFALRHRLMTLLIPPHIFYHTPLFNPTVTPLSLSHPCLISLPFSLFFFFSHFSEMAKAAYLAGADFFYRVNDDTELVDRWPSLFVQALQNLPPPRGTAAFLSVLVCVRVCAIAHNYALSRPQSPHSTLNPAFPPPVQPLFFLPSFLPSI
jgi:hypothetical protein